MKLHEIRKAQRALRKKCLYMGIFRTIMNVTIAITMFYIIGIVGNHELNRITTKEALLQSIISLTVLGISYLLSMYAKHNFRRNAKLLEKYKVRERKHQLAYQHRWNTQLRQTI